MKYLLGIYFTLLVAVATAQEWQVTTISDSGIKPVLTIDNNDKVHIVYMTEASPGWVNYASIENGNLTTMNVSNGYFYGPPDINHDMNNNPIIAYHNHDIEDQAVRIFLNNEWQNIDTPHAGHDGWDNAITTDSNNNIHTSSVDPSSFGGPGVEYGFFNGTEWQVEAVGSGPIMYAHATSIALDSENNIYISYYNDGEGTLKLASKINGTWQIETIDSTPNSGRFSSMIIDENDDIYISYFEDSGLVKLASRKSGIWSFQTIDMLQDVMLGFSGARNITAISKYNDVIGVAYGDKAVVKFATVVGDQVSIETVAENTDQDFGQIVTLDFTSDGTAFVGYSGSTPINNPLGNIFVAQKQVLSSTRQINVKQFNIFPNPVKKGQTLNIETTFGQSQFSLFNIRGQLMESGFISEGNLKIHNNMSSGTYILSITNDDKKEIGFRKFIVTH